jgi:3-mercaptopyruvate sulfurtransferase SseA
VAEYAKDVLVDTQWVEDHLDDPSVRIVEVDENPALYAEGHIPGAIGFDWKTDLQDQIKRDFLDARRSASCSARAASRTSTRSCSTAIATTGSPPTRTGT